MTLEVLDHVEKYRNDLSLNIGELIKGSKIPKSVNGKIIWHNEINKNPINPQDGLCVYCGITSNNLMVLDLDDETLFEYFKIYQDQTFIVKTGKKGFHIYFRTYENPKSKSLTNPQGQHIDILGQGKIAVLPPTIHPETKRQYEIISDKKIKQITTQEEQGLYHKLKDLGFNPEEKKPITELHDRNFVKSEGQNRAEDLLRVIDSWKIKNPEFIEGDLFPLSINYNNTHFDPPYPEDKIKALVKQGFEFGQKKIAEREVKEEIKTEDNQNNSEDDKKYTIDNFVEVADIIQNNNSFKTFKENKDIWCYNKIKGIYEPLGHTIIEEECQKLVRKCKKQTVTEVIETIRRRTMIDMADLLDSKLINTQSGILNPNTFELKPHSSEFLTTTKLPFSVNQNTRNLKLWNHILTIIDPKDINLIMELIWICISWNNPHKKMFVFKGDTNTQKTTLADIIIWIIGKENVSTQKAESYLSKHSRFGTSKFIGKRMNVTEEIGNLTREELENQKSLVGGTTQNTERKNDNANYSFDPERFVFLYTTNELGQIYSSIDDNSVITRFQFLIFRNKIEDKIANGQWEDTFFKDEQDKQSAIDTIVNIVINYKKNQVLGKIPKTKWSNIEETKKILKEQQPIEDKYFEEGKRIIHDKDSKLTLEEIRKDFESYTRTGIEPHKLGYILKRHGMKSSSSNGVTYYKGYAFVKEDNQRVSSFV